MGKAKDDKTSVGVSGYQFSAVFHPAEEGGYVVTVPALPGCISEGDTYEYALINIREAVKAYLESLIRHGEPIPPDIETIAHVEVAL